MNDLNNLTNHKILEIFYREHPELVKTMNNVSHNASDTDLSPHHLEGSIWTHTLMVFNYACDKNYPLVVKLAALLHDLGKTKTKNDRFHDKTGTLRRSFIGHDGVSFYMCLDVLKSYKQFITDDEAKTVAKLVALHSTFYKKHNVHEMFAGESDFLGYLSQLATADAMGRICSDDRNGFQQYFDYTTNVEKQLTENQPVLTVLIGVPCSGKSTYIENLMNSYQNEQDKPVIISSDNIIETLDGADYNEKFKSADFEQVQEQMMKEFNNAVKQRKHIIVDRTNTSKKSRKRFVSVIKQRKNNYFAKAVVFCTSLKEIERRNDYREHTQKKRIPEYVIHDMMKSFSFPLLDEFDKIEMI